MSRFSANCQKTCASKIRKHRSRLLSFRSFEGSPLLPPPLPLLIRAAAAAFSVSSQTGHNRARLSPVLSSSYLRRLHWQEQTRDELGSYLGTVVGGRRGVENGPAGGGIRIFPARGGKHFLLQGGGRVLLNLKKSLKNALLKIVLEICSKYV